MPKIDLPGGHSAVIGLTMREFRDLWQSGAVKRLQTMTEEGSDLGEAYPLLARAVRSWDVTAEDGSVLDPHDPAVYDELEPGTFMRLMGGVAEFIGGGAPKN